MWHIETHFLVTGHIFRRARLRPAEFVGRVNFDTQNPQRIRGEEAVFVVKKVGSANTICCLRLPLCSVLNLNSPLSHSTHVRPQTSYVGRLYIREKVTREWELSAEAGRRYTRLTLRHQRSAWPSQGVSHCCKRNLDRTKIATKTKTTTSSLNS